jgi:MinD-like ATPase involved in chromosome partitioning or flagellar assembly
MAIVAVVGDACTTTTTIALASAWPTSSEALIVEADPRGGDLAAWFDLPVLPSLSTVVTRAFDPSWSEIDRHTRLAPSGLRLIPAPPAAAEARHAVAESARSLAPALAALRTPVAIVDAGDAAQLPAGNHPFVSAAAVTVVVHRQRSQSARAAAVRLQRLAVEIEWISSTSAALVVAVVGDDPFDFGQIESFLADSVVGAPVVGLPVDDLTAAVYAGRTGVSARRLARLPMARAARHLAQVVDVAVQERIGALWRTGR